MASSEGVGAQGFAADAATERALREGLASRDARVRRGRLPVALRALAGEPAAPLVLVDFDGVREPEAAAAQLAAVCAPGTALIAIGSADTAPLARALLERGMADYLVKPVSPAAVREASAAALDDLPERAWAGRVIAVAGSAGSGVATLSAAIARAATGRGGVAVVDLDTAGSRLAALLGAEPPEGLAALLADLEPPPPELDAMGEPVEPPPAPAVDDERIDALRAPAEEGVTLIGYPAEGPVPPPPGASALRALLERLANRTHVVLATGMAGPEALLEVMREADSRVVLFEPTLPSISTAVRCLALLGGDRPALLAQCQPRWRSSSLSRAQVRHALADRHPDVVIPYDPAVGRGRGGKAWRAAVRRVIDQTVESAE